MGDLVPAKDANERTARRENSYRAMLADTVDLMRGTFARVRQGKFYNNDAGFAIMDRADMDALRDQADAIGEVLGLPPIDRK